MLTKTFEIGISSDLDDAITWLASIQFTEGFHIPPAEGSRDQEVEAMTLHFTGETMSEGRQVLQIDGNRTYHFALGLLDVYKRGMQAGMPIPLRHLTIILPKEDVEAPAV